MFGFIKKGLHKIAHSADGVAHAVTSVTHTHLFQELGGGTALLFPVALLKRIPVVGSVAGSVEDLTLMPMRTAQQLAAGGRIDRVALANLKHSIADVKQVAPYAQTVLALVPGVGQGLSGAIGAGLALAEGQNITDALAAGVKGALPGGPLAAAAFELAHGAIQGKPLDQIAIGALPGVSEEQKHLIATGLHVARDLAAGHSVAHEVLDQVAHQLPPEVLQGLTIGAALAHGQVLQAAKQAAAHLQNGLDASDHLLAALNTPAHAQEARQVLEHTKALAAQGHPDALAAVRLLDLRAVAHRARNQFHVDRRSGRLIDDRTGHPAAHTTQGSYSHAQ